MTNNIEYRFDIAMMDIYHRARNEARYVATRFLQMLHEHRGLETARLLLHSSTVSEGYTALWERGRLDLTVEALILQPDRRGFIGSLHRRRRRLQRGLGRCAGDLPGRSNHLASCSYP